MEEHLHLALRILLPAYDLVYQSSAYPNIIHKKSFQLEIVYRYIPLTFFINWIFTLVPYVGNLIMPLLILVGAYNISKQKLITEGKQARIIFLIVVQWGLLGLWSFVGHTILADSAASSIGWQVGSPFQIELAFYHLGLAAASFYLLWNRNIHLLTGIIIAKSIFLFGAMGVHIYHFLLNKNTNSHNIGAGIIFADLIFPVILLYLLFQYKNSK